MRNLVVPLAALAAVGCSTVQVRSTPAPGANLAQLRTFAFMTATRPDVPAAQLEQSPAGQEIRNTIAQNLVDKGYQPAPAGVQPDFLVAYRTRLQEKTDVQTWGPGWGWGWGWGWGYGAWAWDGPDVTVRQYTEGTLVVDFVDPTSHRVLWRGTAVGVVNHPDNPDLNKVAKSVDKLMNRYPPAQVAAVERPRM